MPDIGDIYGGFDMQTKAAYLDEKNNCCGQTMKVWLIICNAILVVLALACLAIGIWVQTMPGFQWTAGSIGVGLILIGVFLILVALLGCFAAWKSIKCLMAVYATLLFIFFIAELAALVVAYAATGVAVDMLTEGWNAMSPDQKDGVGAFFGCCSVSDDGIEKYSKDGDKTFTTCQADDTQLINGESDPKNADTHTKATGVCQIFGLDYKKPGDKAVEWVSFGMYNDEYLYEGSCKSTGGADAEGSACAIWDKDVEECTQLNDADRLDDDGEACVWEAAPGSVCSITTATIAENVPPKEGAEVPDACLCRIKKEDKNGKLVEVPSEEYKTCRQKMGKIPQCDATIEKGHAVPFPFVVGVNDLWVNVKNKDEKNKGLSAPIAACYSKFEAFLSENLPSALIIIGLVFVYQFIQMVFAMLLCCGCCSGNKTGDDENFGSGI